MEKQRTIQNKISFEGVGLHTGMMTKIELLPASPNTGVVFIRKDLTETPILKLDFQNLLNPKEYARRTSIGKEGICIHTIEHLLSALQLLQIDNLQINIWGEEIPGLDGSAKLFVEKIKETGIVEQDALKDYLIIKEPLWVEEGLSSISVLPYPYLRVSYILKYEHPLINNAYAEVSFGSEHDPLSEKIYEARTFCFEEETKPLIEQGLGRGANYTNTLVISREGIINNQLRFPDEPVKHKLLDLIGDLYTIGPLKAYVIAIRSGHLLNLKLLERLCKYKQKINNTKIPISENHLDTKNHLDIQEIMRILPHRYPFLLVDKIVYLEKGKKAVGIKNVSINEYFFEGHFPQKPVMPGVLIVEAMAQVGGVLMLNSEENRGKIAYFIAANNIKFRKTVEPGDQLLIEAEAIKIRSKTVVISAKAYLKEMIVAEGEFIFSLAS